MSATAPQLAAPATTTPPKRITLSNLQIAHRLVAEANCITTAEEGREILHQLADILYACLSEGYDVNIQNIATFSVKHQPGRPDNLRDGAVGSPKKSGVVRLSKYLKTGY